MGFDGDLLQEGNMLQTLGLHRHIVEMEVPWPLRNTSALVLRQYGMNLQQYMQPAAPGISASLPIDMPLARQILW